MLGRLRLSADFERVLAMPPRSRSAHFAVHHLAAQPTLPGRRLRQAEPTDLSTTAAPSSSQLVDETPADWWLGSVVPKRHARRSVTRTLLKRQIRAALQRQLELGVTLPRGLWVVRLKAPFDPKIWPSAASAPLRTAARDELDQLLRRAAA